MSKPKDHDKVNEKPFFKSPELTLYTIKKEGKVTHFKVNHDKKEKIFPVVKHEIKKAFNQLEAYVSKIL